MKVKLAALTAVILLCHSSAFAAPPDETPEGKKVREANALAEEGYGYLTTGRYVEAIYALQRAVELAPNQAFLYYDLGISYFNIGQFERSLEYYDKALAIRPDYANALVNKAKALEKLGKKPEALAAYDKAVEIEPNADDIRIHRGYFYASEGDHAKAIEEYLAGVELNPKNGQGHYWLAQSYAKTGKPAEAWDHVHAAEKAGYPIDPGFLRDLEFQLPETPGSRPPPARDLTAGPVVTQEKLAEVRRENEKSGFLPEPDKTADSKTPAAK